jgi:cytochrome c-type biogenesis protein CcmH/NrfG
MTATHMEGGGMPQAKGNGSGLTRILFVSAATFVLGFYFGIVFMGLRDQGHDHQPQAMSRPDPKATGVEARIQALEQRVKEQPGDVQAWTDLGHLYFDTEQPRKAIEAYTASLRLKPDDPDVLTDMGVMYRQIGQPKEAIELFERALAIDPGHRVAGFNKGIVLLHDMGEREAAISAWEDVLKRHPTAGTPSGQPLADVVRQLKKGS